MKYRLLIVGTNLLTGEKDEFEKYFEAENPDEVAAKGDEQLRTCQDAALKYIREALASVLKADQFQKIEEMIRASFKIAKIEKMGD